MATTALMLVFVAPTSQVHAFVETKTFHTDSQVSLAPDVPIDPASGGAPGASSFNPLCLSSSDTGPRLQAVYLYDNANSPKNMNSNINDIRTMMQESDRIVYLSADKQGGGRRVRINTEDYQNGCRVSVKAFGIPSQYLANGAIDFETLSVVLGLTEATERLPLDFRIRSRY